eukprot:gnl/TRDRNA2_/TRDRNA2_41833_c0_seq1.p1 gnl/TRDRNA2_/TRDRNA2_41833_c0~~gnl/TRDRNA2_/TRDRNA2_41833_c0_seq1.p1  ORF type:complete len:367 (+),score=66.06 gnl/TRDRNA2_/TRDRNA2_41833_c0_seq1:42-1103(+)
MARDSCKLPGPLTSIFGQVYANRSDKYLGVASYHFISETESYVSYEHQICHKIFPRLDDGSKCPFPFLPPRVPFHGAKYDPATRTFRAYTTFSQDCGHYERVRTCDGVEKEVYELTFAEDFETIENGTLKSFFPNASKAHQIIRFGCDVHYVRWHSLREDEADEEDEQKPPVHNLPAHPPSASDTIDALLARDAQKLRKLLEAGAHVNSGVDAVALWQAARLDPGSTWQSQQPKPAASMLAAAILLRWPEGVELCVRHGADVNGMYEGPFPLRDPPGSFGGDSSAGVAMLRLGLSVRGASQCIVCRHLLDGKVAAKTFQSLKRRAKDEMEPDTAALFGHWSGPFAADQSGGPR